MRRQVGNGEWGTASSEGGEGKRRKPFAGGACGAIPAGEGDRVYGDFQFESDWCGESRCEPDGAGDFAGLGEGRRDTRAARRYGEERASAAEGAKPGHCGRVFGLPESGGGGTGDAK